MPPPEASVVAPGTTRHRRQLVDGRLRRQLRSVLVAEVAFVALLAALVARSSTPDRLDAAVARALYAEPGSALRSVTHAVTALGSPVAVVALSLLVAAGAWWQARDAVLAAFSPVAVGATSLTGHVLKLLVERPRPATAALAHEVDFSYPSGHSTGATALALTVVLLAFALRTRHRHAIAAVAGTYAVVMCLSRLVLGVHFLTDILGAIAVGTAGVLLVGWACSLVTADGRWLRPRRHPGEGGGTSPPRP